MSVLSGDIPKGYVLDESEIRFEQYIGTGPGGQHKQKNATAIRAIHVPTGTTVTCQSERSMRSNKRNAKKDIESRLSASAAEKATGETNSIRREQIGTGYRGDKIRTVQMQNNTVTNHITGRKCSAARYLKGELEAIW